MTTSETAEATPTAGNSAGKTVKGGRLLLEHPEVGLKVLKAVGMRLRRLVGLIEELSFTTVRSRLMAQLLPAFSGGGSSKIPGIARIIPFDPDDRISRSS